MGPGFESQRDHKAPKKFGAFFMRISERKFLAIFFKNYCELQKPKVMCERRRDKLA